MLGDIINSGYGYRRGGKSKFQPMIKGTRTDEITIWKNWWLYPNAKLKYWSGTAWVKKTLKSWTGSAWVARQFKYWYYNQWITTQQLLSVGDSYQGGIIAYILQPGDSGYDVNVQHGIIAAASDQTTSLTWGVNLPTSATGSTIGTGQANTTQIVLVYGTLATYAARLCDELSLSGYTDWYLPSINEMAQLYNNRVLIGGFTQIFYWSSTEVSSGQAYYYKFTAPAGATSGIKGSGLAVRAVRSF